MHKGIVISSCAKTARTWLPDCLASLGTLASGITIAWSTPERNEYDVAALRVGIENFDEFWMLPDTTIVKNPSLLYGLLQLDGFSCSAGPGYISCIGKIVTADALAIGLPKWPRSKMEAVQVELGWFRRYAESVGAQVLDHMFMDNERREMRHGRLNMVLESSLFMKFKGTWDVAMIAE